MNKKGNKELLSAIPRESSTPQHSIKEQNISGTPEFVALISGNVAPEHQAKVFAIFEKRLDEEAKKSSRNFIAYLFERGIRVGLLVLILGGLLCVSFCLINKGFVDHGIKLLTHGVVGIGSAIAGYGYGKKEK